MYLGASEWEAGLATAPSTFGVWEQRYPTFCRCEGHFMSPDFKLKFSREYTPVPRPHSNLPRPCLLGRGYPSPAPTLCCPNFKLLATPLCVFDVPLMPYKMSVCLLLAFQRGGGVDVCKQWRVIFATVSYSFLKFICPISLASVHRMWLLVSVFHYLVDNFSHNFSNGARRLKGGVNRSNMVVAERISLTRGRTRSSSSAGEFNFL